MVVDQHALSQIPVTVFMLRIEHRVYPFGLFRQRIYLGDVVSLGDLGLRPSLALTFPSGLLRLADLLAAVDQEVGVATPDNSDLELGHLAMSLHEVAIAQAAGDSESISLIIARDLVSALSLLSATFSTLEASIASAMGS